MQQHQGMLDDPLWFALEMTKNRNKTMMSHINEITEKHNHLESDRTNMLDKLREQAGTRYKTYQIINPDMSVHPLYARDAPFIEDHLRITFTRFRLSAHRLRVEMGRWSRTPAEHKNMWLQNWYTE